MPELILSDITMMGPGYCVIGVEKLSSGAFRSIRPMPPGIGYAWREPFPYKRGHRVRAQLRPSPARPPHFEDRQSYGLDSTNLFWSEDDLVRSLKRAELSSNLEGLFECTPQTQGGNFWAVPDEAARSICGCGYANIRFLRISPQQAGIAVRVEMVLPSNERMGGLPVVDREWRRFVEELVARTNLNAAQAFLNGQIRLKLTHSPNSFARIGLARAMNGKCWFMLDSLFPQPSEFWLKLL